MGPFLCRGMPSPPDQIAERLAFCAIPGCAMLSTHRCRFTGVFVLHVGNQIAAESRIDQTWDTVGCIERQLDCAE